MPSDAENMVAVLQRSDLLKELDPDQLMKIAACSRNISLARGETLVREGDPPDNLYFVIRGMFTVLSGDTPIATISDGEPIGELGFFAGGPRTATVVAGRSSTVLEISQEAFRQLDSMVPELPRAILSALSRRLAEATGARLKLRPRPGRSICVLPGGGERLPAGFVAGLRAALEPAADWRVVTAGDCPDEIGADKAGISGWLEALERAHPHVVLVCEDPEAEWQWFASLADNCDTIHVVGQARGQRARCPCRRPSAPCSTARCPTTCTW